MTDLIDVPAPRLDATVPMMPDVVPPSAARENDHAGASPSTSHVGQGPGMNDVDGRADAGSVEPTPRDSAAAGAANAGSDLRCHAERDTPQRTDYAQPGPYPVGAVDLIFEDTSRSIAATDKHPAAQSRVLATVIYYPSSDQATLLDSAPVAAGGPFAMLMYSHGYSSSRGEGDLVAQHAASYGYVVVVPDFPLTNIFANDGAPDVSDAANQPGDITFLIDELLRRSAEPDDLFANAIDESRIGALGVSLGGLTTLLVSFHPRFQDARIKAALPIAALSSFFAPGFYHTRELPMLLIHGDLDAFVDYGRNARRAFMRASPNARLMTVAKGTHAAFGAQLDTDTIAAINALIAPPDADPSNPDGLGCGAVGATLSMTGPEFLQALGGAEDFITPDPDAAALLPCRGDEYTQPAIDTYEQEAIAVQSAVAFFEAHLAKAPETRQDGCRYLLYELTKNPSVTLE